MQTLLLAMGGLAPCFAMLGICTLLLRRLVPVETYREIAICFLFGLASTVISLAFAIPLDQFTMKFVDSPLALGLWDAFIVAAIPEELARLLVLAWLFYRRRNAVDARRALLLGAVVGLGFASVENPGYCIEKGWPAVWERAVTSVPLHTLSGAFMGYCVAYSRSNRRLRWMLIGLAANVILHGFNNFSFKLWYLDASPEGDLGLPTSGIGAVLITGWPSNIGAVATLIGLVSWLALRRPFHVASERKGRFRI